MTRSGATGQLPFAQRGANLMTLSDLWDECFPVYGKTVAKGTADTNETCWTAHIEPLLGGRPLTDFVSGIPVGAFRRSAGLLPKVPVDTNGAGLLRAGCHQRRDGVPHSSHGRVERAV